MSAGMQRYADELAARLPLVAPDLRFATLVRDRTLDLDEQIALPRRLRAAGARLVHLLSVYAPLFAPRPYVITIHDLIHLRFPEQFKLTVGPYYRTVVRGVCARAARVITDDERTVGDLERFLGVAPAKVRVVPLGIGPEYLESAEAAPHPGARPYFLYVGNHRPHKDLATLISAWEKLPQELDVDLVLTGSDDLGARSRPRNAGRAIRFTGNVEGPALRDLYRGALALISASLCEGFGLPLLEAAALGTPVIASSEAIPGTLRSYAAAFPPRDVAALAAAMARAASSLAARTPASEEAQRFARTQTWDRCAERTAEVYREVLEETEQR
jgi:glycosyltransferase involved in cell wall biosynthesis